MITLIYVDEDPPEFINEVRYIGQRIIDVICHYYKDESRKDLSLKRDAIAAALCANLAQYLEDTQAQEEALQAYLLDIYLSLTKNKDFAKRIREIVAGS